MTAKKVKVFGRIVLGIVLALGCLSNVGLAETQSQAGAGGKTYVHPGFDLRNQVLVKDKTLYVYERVVGEKPCMIITDEHGNIIRDLSLYEPAGYARMLYYRHTSDPAIRFNRKQQKNIEEFLEWEAAAQVALFFRDSASRALVDVGVIYMTGDTSQLTKAVAKKVARSALRSTVEDMIKNPDNYLRAMAVKLCKDARDELKTVESIALSMQDKEKISYDKLEALEARAREAYSKIVPAMGLITALRPGADVISQVKDVLNTMEDRLRDQIPSDFELLTEERAKTMYESLGSIVSKIYKDYKPYRAYLEEKSRYEAMIDEDYSRAVALVQGKLNNGLELSQGYTKFSITPVPPPAEAERMTAQHLGTITFHEAPRTWTINVPEGFEKVEVAIYGHGKEDEQHMYGGWAAWLKVNGKYAWKFVRFDQEVGGIINDYVKGKEVREVTGKDSYCDITSMVTPGKNTITYYHYTEGPGIGVKVRIH